MNSSSNSLEAKIVVLGAQGVGKTSLLLRYIKNQFKVASTASTVGASFLTKRVVDDESDTTVRLQIWDTAGQERFRSISRLYYRGANACILCYDITSVSSFTAMSHWLTELRTHLPPDIILHVVGTKADVVSRDPSARQVPFERCIAYIAENLNPGQTSTPPATATPGGVVNDSQHRKYLPTELGGDGAPKSPGATSNSKRSSGFWGMDIAWDCCHEVSAESGEGVDEVFRVVTRKLVEQNRKIREQLLSATNGALTPGPGMVQAKTPAGFPGTPWAMGRVKEEGEGYLDRLGGERPKVRPGGSFRVGRDRRSWLGFPTPGFDRERSMQGFPWGAGIDNGAIEEGLEGSQAGSQEGKGSREGGRCC